MILPLLLWILPFSLCDPYTFQWNAGGFAYECLNLGTGWYLAGESCFFPYTATQLNWTSAGVLCRNRDLHFSVAATEDNWLVASSLLSKTGFAPNLYWTGVSLVDESQVFYTPTQGNGSAYNPLWAADQPPIQQNRSKCIALDLTSTASVGWRLIDCSEPLSILCQTFACLPDTFRCDDNSRCIPLKAVNDGQKDCLDGSDEKSLSVGRPISRLFASTQEDCRHVLLRGSGEFSSPKFPGPYPAGTVCRWDLEADGGRTIAFTIDGYQPGSTLTVSSQMETIDLPGDKTDSFSTITTSDFLTFRLASAESGQGFRVKFYSTDKEVCSLVDGVAIYDSYYTPFDCSFSAVAALPTQFLLFQVETIAMSNAALVSVTGAGYSFGFEGVQHSQAVVIPSAETVLTVRDAWLSKTRTSFRIRVIPFGSTCLVIPLTIPALSLHWPCQPSPTYVPHCISFSLVGNRGHTWRVDNLQTTRADSVALSAKKEEIPLTAACSYQNDDTTTLSVKQLSPDFTMSFKVSADCEWPTGSYSLGSELACVDGSATESAECQMGGTWSVDPRVCLSSSLHQLDVDTGPNICILKDLRSAYPLSVTSYAENGTLQFQCEPTNVPPEGASCNPFSGICTTTCVRQADSNNGMWDPEPKCQTASCGHPPPHQGAEPLADSRSSYYFGERVNYSAPPDRAPGATAYAVCEFAEGYAYLTTWAFYGFKFQDKICLSYSIPYGHFVEQTYGWGKEAAIRCIDGYGTNQSTTCLESGQWSNPSIACTYVGKNYTKCAPGGIPMANNGSIVCNCTEPYEAEGRPNKQTCGIRSPCDRGTHLCDAGSSCHPENTTTGYRCDCPPGKEPWTQPSNRNLIQNVTCVSECRMEDIPFQVGQFAYGYRDPPGDTVFSVYCRTNPQSLSNASVYILSQSDAKCNQTSFTTVCDNKCEVPGPFPLETYSVNFGIYETVSTVCYSGYGDVPVGPMKSICSEDGTYFRNDNQEPYCASPTCNDLRKRFPGHVINATREDFTNGTTVWLQNCSVTSVQCLMRADNPNCSYCPEWNTTFTCSSEWSNSTPTTVGSTTFSPESTSVWTTSRSTTLGSTTDGYPWTYPWISTNTPGNTWTPPATKGIGPSSSSYPTPGSTSHSSQTSPFLPTFDGTSGTYPPPIQTVYDEGGRREPRQTQLGTPNCTDSVNSCANGYCDTASGLCSCDGDKGFMLSSFVPPHCIISQTFGLWCAGDGETNSNGTCDCSGKFGHGGYEDSWSCLDGPSPDPGCDGLGTAAFTPNSSGSLFQDCFHEMGNNLLIRGDSKTECQCQNGGSCMGEKLLNTLPCNCTDGWVGELCETSTLCQNKTCLNGGVCANGICECIEGWGDVDCRQLVVRDNCSPNKCSHDSDCISTYNSYFCQCHPGFTGRHCNETINYCNFTSPCVNGNCSNAPDRVGVTCNCTTGYTGTNCDAPEEDLLCKNSWCGEGTCLDLIYPDYACMCKTTQFRPIPNAQPNCNGTVLYCTEKLMPCFNNGVCTEAADSLEGGYTCNCTLGYSGDNCENVEPCATRDCGQHGKCQNATGICKCDKGYTGDFCETPLTCPTCLHGFCYFTDTSSFCNCTTGWTGPTCNLTTTNCATTCVHGTCNQLGDGYYCECSMGYKGGNCTDLKSCSEMDYSCDNGGTCSVNSDGTQNCKCPLGIFGDGCEVVGTQCTPDYCSNGGTCTYDIFLNARCLCTENYEGENCQLVKSNSFDLLWTGYKSTQQFVSSQLNTSLYKEFSLCGWVQYAPADRATSRTQLPAFMGIRTTTNMQVLLIDNQGVKIDNEVLMSVSISALQWHHVCIVSPIFNSQRQTWTYYLDGVNVRNTTREGLPQNNKILYMVALDPEGKFQGEISLVQLFYERLTDSQVASLAFDCSNAIKDASLPLLINWNTNFTTLDRDNPGVMQLQPGICDVSSCLPGRHCGVHDKIPPVVTGCPDNIRLVSNKKLTTVNWTVPTFQDNVGVTSVTSNFRPMQAFPWGYYQVIYIASDAAKNTATCQFAVMVAPVDCSAVVNPDGGHVQAREVSGRNSLMVANVICDDANFPQSDPAFFVCDVLGQWNRITSFSPDKPFSFPSCGNTTFPTQNINGTLSANSTSCDDVYNQLNSTLTSVTGPYCNDSSCFSIYPQCDNTADRSKRGILDDIIREFGYMISVNNTRQMLENTVESSVRSAFPDGQSSIFSDFECDEEHPLQYIDGNSFSCGDCAAGTWWNDSTSFCDDCPEDTYRAVPPIAWCVKCPENKTTGGLKRVAEARGCYLNCTVGHYYDLSSEDCLPCPVGRFQNATGRTECLSCPLYYSTFLEGATNPEDCSKTCGPGLEFDTDLVNCIPCPVGTFKNGTAMGCIVCDTGWTTSGTGSTSPGDCNVVYCPPNTKVNLKPNATLDDYCVPCTQGTWTPDYNSASCVNCENEDQSPTCSLTSDCAPSLNLCEGNKNCTQSNNTYMSIPIYQCLSVSSGPEISGPKNSMAIVWVIVAISIVIILITLAIVAWIFRDRLPCVKFFQDKGEGLPGTSSDFYRTPRINQGRRPLSTSTASSKSDGSTPYIREEPELERPRMLPPPIITSRSALEAMNREQRPPPAAYTIPRIPQSSRNRSESDEVPVVREAVNEDDDDDDYFG